MPRYQTEHTARGCCVEGVEIYQGEGDTAGAEDLKMIRGRVAQLTDEDWQNRQLALRRGGRDPWGKARFKRDSVHTRLYRDGCIFHNRADHPAGAGCAFHVAALRHGESPIDWKPRICWQVPLFFDIDNDTRTTTVRACRTVDWAARGSSSGGAPSSGRVQRQSAAVRDHGGRTPAHVRRRRLRRAGRLLPGAADRRRASHADVAADGAIAAHFP